MGDQFAVTGTVIDRDLALDRPILIRHEFGFLEERAYHRASRTPSRIMIRRDGHLANLWPFPAVRYFTPDGVLCAAEQHTGRGTLYTAGWSAREWFDSGARKSETYRRHGVADAHSGEPTLIEVTITWREDGSKESVVRTLNGLLHSDDRWAKRTFHRDNSVAEMIYAIAGRVVNWSEFQVFRDALRRRSG